MSHQSDWGHYKQPMKLAFVKVNHVRGDFILILKRPSLFFYKQKQVFLYYPYSDTSFSMVEPRTLWMGFKRVQNSIISRRTIVFGIH